jgi:hypothetical protein
MLVSVARRGIVSLTFFSQMSLMKISAGFGVIRDKLDVTGALWSISHAEIAIEAAQMAGRHVKKVR